MEALFWMSIGGIVAYFFGGGKGDIKIGEEILLKNGKRATVVDSKDLEDMMEELAGSDINVVTISKDEESLI